MELILLLFKHLPLFNTQKMISTTMCKHDSAQHVLVGMIQNQCTRNGQYSRPSLVSGSLRHSKMQPYPLIL
jgi:hypothetical protein